MSKTRANLHAGRVPDSYSRVLRPESRALKSRDLVGKVNNAVIVREEREYNPAKNRNNYNFE